MSLNCLTCQRTNSLRGGIEAAITVRGQKAKIGQSVRRHQVDRSWSGNLVTRLAAGNNNGAATSNPGMQKVEGVVSQRRHSGPVECETPRLVRSSGMRRDWSFEDLRQKVKAGELNLKRNLVVIKQLVDSQQAALTGELNLKRNFVVIKQLVD